MISFNELEGLALNLMCPVRKKYDILGWINDSEPSILVICLEFNNFI